MLKFARPALGALLAVGGVDAVAAPAVRIVYHETLRIQARQSEGHTRAMSFDAYGQRFELELTDNEGIRRAVPASRPDIEPLRGTVPGQPGSWVRITHTRSGWRGILFDGQELYAIEPAHEVAGYLVQPLLTAGPGDAVIYRLKDALLAVGPAFCEIAQPDSPAVPDSAVTGSSGTAPATSPVPKQVSAQALYSAMATGSDTQSTVPTLRLLVGVIADYEFLQEYSDDPEGTLISRMDIVDGIYSSQVGVKIALAPLTIQQTSQEPFTSTDPNTLLSQVRQFRHNSSEQMATGVTHLMTGRDLDGSTVGIAYMGSVCDGDTADSLSEGNHSSLMSALIAAHELGHNFNAPHDGVPGACASTPQIYLMAPQINFSQQFSACSLQQIHLRIQTAQCLTPYTAPDVSVTVPESVVHASAASKFTLSFVVHADGDDPSTGVTASAALSPNLTLQSVTVPTGSCSSDGTSVSCNLGTLNPKETRQVSITLVGGQAGTSPVTVAVKSANDAVAGNDSAQISVEISAADPTTAPAGSAGSGAGSGSGGGGGRLDLLLLAVLSAAVGTSALRRRSAETLP